MLSQWMVSECCPSEMLSMKVVSVDRSVSVVPVDVSVIVISVDVSVNVFPWDGSMNVVKATTPPIQASGLFTCSSGQIFLFYLLICFIIHYITTCTTNRVI